MRRTSLLAIAFASVDIGLVTTMAGVSLMPMRAGVPNGDPAPFIVALVLLFFVTTPVVAGLIAARQPRNPIGWLFLSVPFWFELSFAVDAIGRRVPASQALGLLVTVGSDLGGVSISALLAILALFPSGRLPGPRWRLVLVFVAIGTVLDLVSGAFATTVIQPEIPGLPLPLAHPEWQPAVSAIGGVASLFFLAALAGLLALFVVRFRRAKGVERQQLKWFLWAGAFPVSILFFGLVITPVSSDLGNAGWIGFLASLILLPIAAAIAILRYRLYDIDLIIRRTLVYATLSAVLLAAYAASVLVLRQVLAPLAPNNSIAVAVSTLLVAALFSPVRRRVQATVDRRFYRQRYSATREIARFGASLRDEVDIERVRALLAGTVDRTVQPAFTSVWLRRTDG